MSGGFTSGPWEHGGSDDVYAVYAHPEGVATTVADCNSGMRVVQDDDECAANARLIAAAPELFEALEAAQSVLATDGRPVARSLFAQIDRLLAKARGNA